MNHHKVQLEYAGGVVHPTPEPLLAEPGDVVSFILVNPPDAELTIRFDEPANFSAAEFKRGDEPVMIKPLTGPTTYTCAVTMNGVTLELNGPQGGSIKPPR
jgi:hypothetical protein